MNKDDVKIWYKVIDKNNCAFNSGSFDYSKYLPKKNGKTGKWLPTIDKKDLSICNCGYHVTPYWNMWYRDGCKVFEVEVKNIVDIDESGVVNKFVCGSFRFIKELDLDFDEKDNTGDWNTGDRNTGDWNTGDWNTGDKNTGDWNTGDWNTGDKNTGYWNTGDKNTGDRNTGDKNTGYWNTGSRNTGDRNTGDKNTGYWNTGDKNSGFLNTDRPKIRIFNKETDEENIIFPDYFYFNIQDNDNDLHKSWLKSFNEASKHDVKKTLKLPNFDYKIFEEISGISKKMLDKKLITNQELKKMNKDDIEIPKEVQ